MYSQGFTSFGAFIIIIIFFIFIFVIIVVVIIFVVIIVVVIFICVVVVIIFVIVVVDSYRVPQSSLQSTTQKIMDDLEFVEEMNDYG